MLGFIIAIIIFTLLILIFNLIKIKIMVNRFLEKVEFVATLEEWLLGGDELEEECSDASFGFKVGKYYVEFDRFVDAMNYFEEYTKEVKEEYQKIIELTDSYDLSKEEKSLDQALYKIRIWRWKNNCIEI